jgi:hypothetical protein
MNDPIVEEVRRIREAHAARFNYDWDAIYQDIKEQEKKSGLRFVSFTPPQVEPDQARPSAEPVPAVSPDGQSPPIGAGGSPGAKEVNGYIMKTPTAK